IGAAPIGAPTTIMLPAITLPPVVCHAPAPRLISPDVGAEHVGLTREALVEMLREMRADPKWAARVIAPSRKRVMVAPDDLIAFMRERYSAKVETCAAQAAPANDAEHDERAGVDHVLAMVGAERVAAPERSTRRTRAARGA